MLALILGNMNFSSFNILMVSTGIIITLVSIISSRDYSYSNTHLFYICNLIYILGFTMIIMTENWIIFIIGWELVTVSTFLLLLWGSNKIARVYLIIQFIGSNFLLYVVLMIMNAGYTTIGPIDNFKLQLLLIIGVGVKSAIIGLHFWLPIVHSRAPAPVSAILSGWVVKLGFIVLLKTVTTGNILLFYAGIAMVIYAGIQALLATDYKVLLAFSTISQLGFIAIGIGSGNYYAYWGSALHIIVHGLAKTSLFLSSGYWVKSMKSRSIYQFKNGWFKDKTNSIITILGLTVLAGFPILAGYNSKHLIKYAAGNGWILKYVFHGLSLITYLYVLRFIKLGIFNLNNEEKRDLDEDRKVIGLNALSALILPIILVVLITLRSNIITGIDYTDYHLLHGFIISLIYILISITVLKLFNWIHIKEKPVPSMDLLLIRIKNGYRWLNGSPRLKRLEVDMENQIYNIAINFAKMVYDFLPKTIQSQLLFIPVVLLFLLIFYI